MKPLTALFVLFLSVAAFGQAKAPNSERKKGSLEALVERASENLLRRDSDAFRVPTDGQLKAWRFIVESIFAGRAGDAQRMIEQLSFPYELSFFTEKSNGREYVVLEEKQPLQAGWGLYVFDLRAKNPLVIEIPHPVFDSNTEFQGIDAFLQTGARAFLLAGAHRRANRADTPCTQPKSANADANYPVSDVAHAVATPFHAVHETLVRISPATVAVQLHGMTERDVCPSAFLSTGTAVVTTNAKRLGACLAKSGVEAEIYDGRASCPLNALSNVQGRFSNGETADPCRKNATASPEPGRFIHVEQEPSVRRDRASWQKVIDALKCAFPADAEPAPKEPDAYVFRSAGNPDVKIFYAAPPKISAKTRVLFVMAGRQRNADEYLASWADWAGAHDYLVLAPQFDEANWPEPLGYNFGNIASGREKSNTPNPPARWSFALVERMFAGARTRFAVETERYDLFGHSAGGQFVHRMMLFYPENSVRLAIAANPGFYTLPDADAVFPYGLKNSPVAKTREELVEWTKRDLVIMRGTKDLERTESLRQTPEADAQGANRFARAATMYERVKALNPNTKWRLVDVPGVAHDQRGMARAAQALLETESR